MKLPGGMVARARRTTSTVPFLLGLLLGVPPDLNHAFVVTVHTIDALARPGEDKFFYPFVADLAFETVSMIRVLSGHDGFVQDRLMTNAATIRAIGANRGAIR